WLETVAFCKSPIFQYIGNGRKRRQTGADTSIFGRSLVARGGAMSGTVKHARLESQSARDRLKRRRQPHWQALVEGRVHLGWQRWKGQQGEGGRGWLLRRYIGNNKYRMLTLGRADDVAQADGVRVLSHEQAEAKARAMVGSPQNGNRKPERLTVRQAMEPTSSLSGKKGSSLMISVA